MKLTEALIEEVFNTRFEDIPEGTVDILRRTFLDCLGIALFSYHNIDKPLARYARMFAGNSESTLIGDGEKVPCVFAAAVNAQMCEDSNFQQTGPDLHDLPAIFNTALSVGERVGASGKEVATITATVYEITCRLSRNIQGPPDYLKFPRFIRRHLPLMAGMCAAKLMGFPTEIFNRAMGIAWMTYVPNPMSMTYGMVGGEEQRRISPLLWGTQCGIQAAFLAEFFGEGPLDILDSRAAREIYSHEGVFNSPKKFHAIDNELCLKGYIGSYGWQGGTELAARMVRDLRIQPDAIERVVFKGGKEYATAPTLTRVKAPQTYWEARGSIGWILANAILGYEPGHDWVSPKDLKDPDRLKLAQKVEVAAGPHIGNVIEITAGGKTYTDEIVSWDDFMGSPKRRLSWEQVQAKFTRLAIPVIGEKQATEVTSLCKNFEKIDNVSELTAHLSRASK